jgi:hypothetical protein
LLEPVHVVNPYARDLTFADARTRTRRDHEKYLTLIDAVAFLHQHQRARKTVTREGRTLVYLEVTAADVAVANRLAGAVLARALDDLPPQARKLLTLVTQMVDAIAAREHLDPRSVRFTRRAVRHFTGWTDFQVRAHLGQLQTLEYVIAHRGMQGQRYEYTLLYLDDEAPDRTGSDGAERSDPALHLLRYGADFEGSAADFEGALSPGRAPSEGRVRPPKSRPISPADTDLVTAATATASKNTNGARPPENHTVPADRRGAR